MKYSSTVLKLFDQNCPGAMQNHIDGVPFDRELFQPGIAAHAVLQVVADKGATEPDHQRTVADAVVEELITHGRSFNNVPEPPMSPSAAFEGRDVALDYLAYNPLPDGLLSVEGGYGMTAEGEPCAYDAQNVRYRAIFDLVYGEVVGDEDYAADMLVVRDYKSAWPTGEAELDTLQRKGQAVLACKHFAEGYAGVILEVANLRTGMTFTRPVYFHDEEGAAMLAQWEQDILTACTAADQVRAYRPGAGCLSCAYAASCEACLEAAKADTGDIAVQLAAIEARRSELTKVLKAKAQEAPIEIPGGFVGYQRQEKQTPNEDAYRLLAENWCADDEALPFIKGLLKAERLTKANIENVLKVLFPGKEGRTTREDLLRDMLTTRVESRFGVHADKQALAEMGVKA